MNQSRIKKQTRELEMQEQLERQIVTQQERHYQELLLRSPTVTKKKMNKRTGLETVDNGQEIASLVR